jgi:hypothetical protein
MATVVSKQPAVTVPTPAKAPARWRRWRGVMLAAIPVLGFLYAAAPAVFPYDARPGAPVGQTLGILAGCLMIATLLYLPAKRSDMLSTPNRRLVLAHVVLGTVGFGIALAHSRLVLDQPPILVLLAFLGLLASGAYGRVIASRRLGPTFGRGGHPFRPATGPPLELRAFVARKQAVLHRLAPGAREATFTLTLSEWGRHPVLALRYYALSLEERRRMRALAATGYAERMGRLEGLWRVGHLLLAWAAVIGLLAHVTTTLFFADFATGGREVYWWHIRK